MCGIVVGIRRDGRPVAKSLLKRFNKQRNRGTEGFGYISIEKGKVILVERSTTEGGIEKKLKESNGSEIFFHHRWPTSTPNYEEATHPIVVKNDSLKSNYYVIHNGVLRNHEELKVLHEAMGFKYTTEFVKTETLSCNGKTIATSKDSFFNDSEALAVELALYLENKKYQIDTQGGVAFVCIQTDKDDNVEFIHYGRNTDKPLVVEDNNDIFFIKSTGSGKSVPVDTLISINYKSKDVVENSVDIGETYVKKIGYNLGNHGGPWEQEKSSSTHVNSKGNRTDLGNKKKDIYRGVGAKVAIEDKPTNYTRNLFDRNANTREIVKFEEKNGEYLEYDENVTREVAGCIASPYQNLATFDHFAELSDEESQIMTTIEEVDMFIHESIKENDAVAVVSHEQTLDMLNKDLILCRIRLGWVSDAIERDETGIDSSIDDYPYPIDRDNEDHHSDAY